MVPVLEKAQFVYSSAALLARHRKQGEGPPGREGI
jgi:hypothetical protein